MNIGRLVDIERKCEFNSITPEETITYKFAATINDKKARGKFIKGPLKLQMVLETIEQDNHNLKYGDKKTNKRHRKLHLESSSSEEQVAYTHPARKRKIAETGKKKMPNRNCHFCGKPNWSLEHVCPARRAQCNNCKKMGHFAKVCKSKTVSRVQKEPSTDSNTKSWPEIDHIQSVNGINWIDFYKAILLVQGKPIEIIIDTGSPVTIIPPIIKTAEIHKTTKSFVDLNKNPIKFKGEVMVEVKTEKSKVTLPILIPANKNTQPLLGLDWLDKLEIGLQGNKNTNIIRHIETDERRQKIVDEYEDLFKNNHTIKDPTVDIQFKKDTKPIQQKGRPVKIHFQKTVKKEVEKLIESGHLEKTDKTTENCFISPAVIII